MQFKKTKIVCTLGPSTDDPEVLRKMIKAGMNVARLNMSHGAYHEQAARIATVKALREELGMPIGILLDTKGPEVRVKTFKDGRVTLNDGDPFTLVSDANVLGDNTRVAISFADLYKYLKKDDVILADDGNIEMRVESVDKEEIKTVITVGGVLSNRKSLNFPNIEINMEYLSENDKKDIAFGIEQDIDFIALSFVRCAQDVQDIRDYLKTINGEEVRLISKIENRQGVKNMDSIIEISNGIMVARGDMGVEIPFEELPAIQKKLIKGCFKEGKAVITATQMLESMITHARPTRAEISDVANAVYDGTSATMLSGETAAGKYPVEAVKAMAKIILQTENAINYKKRFHGLNVEVDTIDDAIAHAAINAAHDLNAKAVITVTYSGMTARKISGFRPFVPIIAATRCDKTYYKLSVIWGVIPVHALEKIKTDELIAHACECALTTEAVKEGDLVVITAGVPLGVSGNTNVIKIQKI
ncbi:MAG: pyruvate kinase [Chitinispirillia bacterium]|nr:pyruvate kinase [Chitinispirillia bacterium]MCL2269590.1 pyruvate kinase [Chitinispirillia bacterium]